jgi:hypothetical protein
VALNEPVFICFLFSEKRNYNIDDNDTMICSGNGRCDANVLNVRASTRRLKVSYK